MRALSAIVFQGMNAMDIVTEKTLALSLRKEFGFRVAPDEIRLEHRSWRWLAHLPGDFVAHIADSPEATRRLANEHAVLDLLNERVSFGTPRVELSSPDGGLQVRRKVIGLQVGGNGAERQIANSSVGARLAEELGRGYAELHQSISLKECELLGIGQGGTFPSPDELEGRLSGRLAEPKAANALQMVLTHYKNLEVPQEDLVFTHGDPWGGNLAVDWETGALNGIFDFDAMCVDDRSSDLRYLHSFGEEFKGRALAAYAQFAGTTPPLKRISLYHLVSAFEALANAVITENEDRIAYRQQWVDLAVKDLIDDLL